jgi:hypothetical protein
MREDDIESYFKFMELYERHFKHLTVDEVLLFALNLIQRYHKAQIRSNFLQTRTT